MFIPSNYFNNKQIKASDFYSANPPSPNPIHEAPINLSGGRPNAGFYPIQQIDLHIQNEPFSDSISSIHTIPLKSNELDQLDISRGLNYAPGQGFPELIHFINKIGEFHGINQEINNDLIFDSLVTSGSGDSLSKVLGTLINPGDTILVEKYTYTPIFASFEIHGAVMIPYETKLQKSEDFNDHIDPMLLENQLKNWKLGKYKDLNFPKAIFTVPTHNPTGFITNSETIKQIVEIANKFDLLIIEDDPDGFIRHLPIDTTFDKYIQSLHNSSYLSTNSSRILHLGTLSKTIAPGIRLGFIIAHKQFIKRLTEYSKTVTKAPSGFSQLIFSNLIKNWSNLNVIKHMSDPLITGYLSWCFKLSKEYTQRSNTIFQALSTTKSNKIGLIKPINPQGGMFFIIHINNLTKPGELEKLRWKFVKFGVLVILGPLMSFINGGDVNSGDQDGNFIRLTLANSSDSNEFIEGIKRLDCAVLEYFNEK